MNMSCFLYSVLIALPVFTAYLCFRNVFISFWHSKKITNSTHTKHTKWMRKTEERRKRSEEGRKETWKEDREQIMRGSGKKAESAASVNWPFPEPADLWDVLLHLEILSLHFAQLSSFTHSRQVSPRYGDVFQFRWAWALASPSGKSQFFFFLSWQSCGFQEMILWGPKAVVGF